MHIDIAVQGDAARTGEAGKHGEIDLRVGIVGKTSARVVFRTQPLVGIRFGGTVGACLCLHVEIAGQRNIPGREQLGVDLGLGGTAVVAAVVGAGKDIDVAADGKIRLVVLQVRGLAVVLEAGPDLDVGIGLRVAGIAPGGPRRGVDIHGLLGGRVGAAAGIPGDGDVPRGENAHRGIGVGHRVHVVVDVLVAEGHQSGIRVQPAADLGRAAVQVGVGADRERAVEGERSAIIGAGLGMELRRGIGVGGPDAEIEQPQHNPCARVVDVQASVLERQFGKLAPQGAGVGKHGDVVAEENVAGGPEDRVGLGLGLGGFQVEVAKTLFLVDVPGIALVAGVGFHVHRPVDVDQRVAAAMLIQAPGVGAAGLGVQVGMRHRAAIEFADADRPGRHLDAVLALDVDLVGGEERRRCQRHRLGTLQVVDGPGVALHPHRPVEHGGRGIHRHVSENGQVAIAVHARPHRQVGTGNGVAAEVGKIEGAVGEVDDAVGHLVRAVHGAGTHGEGLAGHPDVALEGDVFRRLDEAVGPGACLAETVPPVAGHGDDVDVAADANIGIAVVGMG